jgi:hypothetical protein
MNCSNNCVNNISESGSRYSKKAYNGTDNIYIKLPDLDLTNKTITFSINFKTNNTPTWYFQIQYLQTANIFADGSIAVNC